jgi:predicted dinucleotide-binding enzyme
VVRAFNCIPAGMVKDGATLKGERIAIPMAGDDPEAVQTAERLVRDAGFDPVLVGGLRTATWFDLGAPLAHGLHTAPELRKMITEVETKAPAQ